MRFIHRFAFRAPLPLIAELRDLGMKFEPEDEVFHEPDPMIAFRVPEDHPHWPLIQARMHEWKNSGHMVYTEFTPRELDAARWLHTTAWDNGYALPFEDFKFFEVTFDRSHACLRCGYGKVQNAPFRIKGEPKWGRRAIMSLNQAYDELFVPPAIWETIFKPFGIASRSVANRHGKLLQTVVQLVIEEEIDLATDLLPIRERCPECGQPKYQYPERGPFPALAQGPSGPIARTRQTFFDGWHTRHIIISQELRRAMMAHKIRGADFTPVESHLDAFEA